MKNNDLEEICIKEQLEELYKLINQKNYETIYEVYGKKIYNFVTPKQYKKKDIKDLIQKKAHSSLYNRYGKIQTIKIRDLRKNKNLKFKLQKQSKYTELSNKLAAIFGASSIIVFMLGGVCIYKEMQPVKVERISINENFEDEENFSKPSRYTNLEAAKLVYEDTLEELKNLQEINNEEGKNTNAIYEMAGLNFYNTLVTKSNEKLFIEEQKEYEEKIEKYADEINELNLTDLQVIMKVIDDQWNTISGYGQAKKDIYGLYRLDVSENSAAMCRNLSDDFSAKMNAINPKYNARNLVVYQDNRYYTNDSFANINRTIDNNSYKDNSIEQKYDYSIYSSHDMSHNFGNHAVSILEIREENLTLIVDPLNPSIGVLKDGEIYMLSTINGEGLEDLDIGNIRYYSINDYFKTSFSKINSYKNEININDAIIKYGTNAQNEALEYVRNLDNTKVK